MNFRFNIKLFHKDCDNKGIIIFYSNIFFFEGSTLVIMHSNKEPNSFFGGMAASSWNSEEKNIADPKGECSWLFKIEAEENM